MSEWLQNIYDYIPLSPEIRSKVFISISVVLLLWILHRLILFLVWRQTENPRTRYLWHKNSGYLTFTLGVILLAATWIGALRSVGTFLGLLSAGLAIALKDFVVNFASWLFIIWRRPFELGDRIQVGDTAGDVIDIRIFQFSLLEIGNWVDADQSTGRIIHIPNGKVLTDNLANYTRGFMFIWNELPVMITFESNWRKAKDILQKIADEHAQHLSDQAEKKVKDAARKYLIFYTKLTPIVYTSIADSGVVLTIRYLCQPRRRRGTAEAIWEDILGEFAKNDDIDFAYPTRRYYDNRIEGKPGAGGTGH